MRKLILVAAVSLVVLVLGLGLGYFVGSRVMGSRKVLEGERAIEPPGPTFEVGEFNVNLADQEPHLVNFKLVLELTSQRALQTVSDPSWGPRIKNEVIMAVKDRRYVDLLTSEGVLELAADLRKRLNSILPYAEGKPPVKGVFFTQFLVQ